MSLEEQERLFLGHSCLIVIPTYNEVENISDLIAIIHRDYPLVDILIVDDSSPDQTGLEVQKIMRQNHRVFLKTRPKKMGLGRAYQFGFSWALERPYRFIMGMDCDFSHDPKDIKKLLQACQQNDLVIGSRYIDGSRKFDLTWRRTILSLVSNFITRLLLGHEVKDFTSGFKCFSRHALYTINPQELKTKGFGIQIELIFKALAAQLSFTEVPVNFKNRVKGESKMSIGIVLESLYLIIRLRCVRFFRYLKGDSKLINNR
jgi:dolichol-phosphate mannosyltransferase